MKCRYAIVVADDDPLMNVLLREILLSDGYEVLCCFSGAEAERVIQRVKPDAAIVDMQMEVRDAGLQLLKSVRQNPTTAHISVIICSADLSYLDEQREQITAYGAEVMFKPFTVEQILKTVRRMLVAEVS